MKYFKRTDGSLCAFADDGSQDAFIPNGAVQISAPTHYTQQWNGSEWVAPDATVPQVVTRAQGKVALINAGYWSAVQNYVESISDPTEKAVAEVALNDTLSWKRNSDFLQQAAIALGMSSEDLDDLFVAASQVEL